MKYSDFCVYLTHQTGAFADIGPYISVKLDSGSASVSSKQIECKHRFLVMPIKICSLRAEGQHLNVFLLDRKTKVLQRYEPFGNISYDRVNKLVEPLMYKLMNDGKIYFLQYSTILGGNTSGRNCCIHCVNYVKSVVTTV